MLTDPIYIIITSPMNNILYAIDFSRFTVNYGYVGIFFFFGNLSGRVHKIVPAVTSLGT
jgi:hypothetical protein